MGEHPSLIGNRYGKLTVIEQVESTSSGQRRWSVNVIVEAVILLHQAILEADAQQTAVARSRRI